MQDDPNYVRVKREVEALKGFYIHALVYSAVTALLLGINLMMSGANWWSLWPAAGWGIALAIHGLAATGRIGLFGREWEERKIRERLGRS